MPDCAGVLSDPGVVAVGAAPVSPSIVLTVSSSRRRLPCSAGSRRAPSLGRALQRAGELRRLYGLEQVVDGTDVERAQGELVVRGDEDHRRHAVGANRVDEREAAHLAHLHIEEDDIGREVRRSPSPRRCRQPHSPTTSVPGISASR